MHSQDVGEHVAEIHGRLMDAEQHIYVHSGETTGTISHARISLTAEFYRIAALLYLDQEVARPAGLHKDDMRRYVREGFALLDQMEVCTSPWPLFVLACNVGNDEERIKIMRVIEDGSRERGVGNYRIIASLVKTVWKRQDVVADEKEEVWVDWRELIKPEEGIPSFI
jgi:hypothetical protein